MDKLMEKIEEVRNLVKKVIAEDLPLRGLTDNDEEYVVEATAKGFNVTMGTEKYTVAGTKRLVVSAVKPEKVKKEKTPKAPRVKKEKPAPKDPIMDVKCRECGSEFKLSKFTPYLDICPDCRKKKIADGMYLDGETSQIERVCEVTGKKFKTSKFTPYVTISPEGRKILADKAKAEREAANPKPPKAEKKTAPKKVKAASKKTKKEVVE